MVTFLLERKARLGPTKQFAFLLEIDMGSEDNPRFAREKVRPGASLTLEAEQLC